MEREPILSLTKKDFRVDTFRSGGKGGQHQNKTDSGVRITHLETGISSESRSHKSQAQNKKVAFRKLAEKLRPWIKRKVGAIEYESKRVDAGFGSPHVRTYNLHANRITDHDSGVKIEGPKDVGDVLDGGLDGLLESRMMVRRQRLDNTNQE